MFGSFGGGGAEPEEGSGDPSDPSQPGNCAEGAPHPGFAGHDFVSDRKPGALGDDRRRVKPFSALRTEVARSIGAAPASIAQSSAAFGDVPARWYAEPTAGAVSLYTTYGIAFTACYDAMTQGNYTQMPTAETAQAECARWQRKAWLRTPTADETRACVDLAVTGPVDVTHGGDHAARMRTHAAARPGTSLIGRALMYQVSGQAAKSSAASTARADSTGWPVRFSPPRAKALKARATSHTSSRPPASDSAASPRASTRSGRPSGHAIRDRSAA